MSCGGSVVKNVDSLTTNNIPINPTTITFYSIFSIKFNLIDSLIL
jgi:hypothetical protein